MGFIVYLTIVFSSVVHKVRFGVGGLIFMLAFFVVWSLIELRSSCSFWKRAIYTDAVIDGFVYYRGGNGNNGHYHLGVTFWHEGQKVYEDCGRACMFPRESLMGKPIKIAYTQGRHGGYKVRVDDAWGRQNNQ